MTGEQRAALLTALEEEQRSGGMSVSGTSPITVCIGYVQEIVRKDGIVVVDAPGHATAFVLDWVRRNSAGDVIIRAAMSQRISPAGLLIS